MGLVESTAVDGVRTFWVDSGRPTLAATLMFRVGAADETVATSGWLHLLEHLALHDLPRGTLAVNGSVAPLLTTFSVHGPREQVVAALAAVTRRLAEPDLRELDRERRVLAAEAATRGGPVPRAFAMRYGATGPGLVAWDDLGLGRARADDLVALSRRAFAAGNATLALDGPPPEGLSLALAPGDTLPVRPARQVERSRSAYPDPGGLVLSGVVPRSAAGAMVPALVEDALRRRLREQDGTAYSPYSLYEAVDADDALVVAGTDVSTAAAPTLLGTVLDLLDGLVARGPEPQSLADLTAAMRQGLTDPYNIGFLSHRAAAHAVAGRPVQQLDEILDELDADTPESLVPALTAFRDSLLVGAPPTTQPHARLQVVREPETNLDPRGRRFRSAAWPADGTRLTVADDLVVVGDGDLRRKYAFEDLAGYLVWDDGTRALVREDGWTFQVRPGDWRRGARAVALLDAAVTPSLHLPQPAETAPPAAVLPPVARRWAMGVLRLAGTSLRRIGFAALWYGLLVTVAVVAVVTGRPGLVGPMVLGAWLSHWLVAARDD